MEDNVIQLPDPDPEAERGEANTEEGPRRILNPSGQPARSEEPPSPGGPQMPDYLMVAAAAKIDDENLGFSFKTQVPEEPQVFDLITFFYICRHQASELYLEYLDRAAEAYLELDDEASFEQAKAEVEEYVRAKCLELGVEEDTEDEEPIIVEED